jgi:hypothetical protein
MLNYIPIKNILKILCCGALILIICAGCKKAPVAEQEVYINDFEKGDLTKISDGKLNQFNNSAVIGYYHDGGFDVNLDNLPKHDLIRITFDLYIHDSWAGNNTGNETVIDGPDIWQMKADGNIYINTTFSNLICDEAYCLVQSYPHNYPYRTRSGEGAFRRDLPGVCFLKDVKGGSSLYKIEKIIKHTRRALSLEFKDLLKQSNATDPLCDESWSMDNLVISTSILK